MSTATASAESSMESFAALFEESLARQEMRAGEVITAEVVRVDQNFVVVNAGLKSESYVNIDEFRNDRGEVEVQPGDYIQVAIEMLEDGYGETRLSRDKAKRIAAWNDLEKALNEGTLVKGLISGRVKGGLTVMTNSIRAFLPGSLVDMRPVKDTTPYEGKEFEFKVIKLDRKRNNVVVSRRAVLEETQGVAPATFSLIQYTEFADGIWYPKGGMYRVVEALVSIAEKAGVRFLYDTPVEGIRLDGDRATGVTRADGG